MMEEINNASASTMERSASFQSQGKPEEALYNKIQGDGLGKILTHGYVHGHIHRHKDHTHIHGHIHNHDHDHQEVINPKTESQDKVIDNLLSNVEDCKQFEELAYCKDIFCDDLDDCFFLSCDDSKKSTGTVSNSQCELVCETGDESFNDTCCSAPNCVEVSNEAESEIRCCEDESCFSSDEFSSTDSNKAACSEGPATDNSLDNCDCCPPSVLHSSCTDHHQDVCDAQLSKRPIFENLITNVHQNLSQLESTEDHNTKRRKIENQKDIQIHFPHACHQELEALASAPIQEQNVINASSSNSHNHIRQSCFHTSIPNTDTANVPNPDDLMLDFDFYVQFNTFNQLLNGNLGLNQPLDKSVQSGHNNLNLNNSKPQPSDFDFKSEMQSQLTLSPNPVYPCQWDNCFSKVTDDTFMNHLMNQHIRQEYSANMPTSINPKATSYQCEWNDCDYIDDNLEALIDHLNKHKDQQGDFTKFNNESQKPFLPTLSSQNPILLTPSSTISSPLQSDVTLEKSKESEINITALKIMPKKRIHTEHNTQPGTFTCKWEVGTDSAGKSIPCNHSFKSDGDLQSHLINDHIGSGKSVYHCKWQGCDRHNGKSFSQRQKLLRHIHTHTNYKPCKCEICGASFAVDSILKQHMRTHSGEKPFECSICGKHFATSSSLSIHKRVHSGEKPLTCKWPGCNKCFRESSNLTKHMRTHYKTFRCEECGEEFEKKPNYTKHMKTHKKVVKEESKYSQEWNEFEARKPEIKAEAI